MSVGTPRSKKTEWFVTAPSFLWLLFFRSTLRGELTSVLNNGIVAACQGFYKAVVFLSCIV